MKKPKPKINKIYVHIHSVKYPEVTVSFIGNKQDYYDFRYIENINTWGKCLGISFRKSKIKPCNAFILSFKNGKVIKVKIKEPILNKRFCNKTMKKSRKIFTSLSENVL